MKNLRDKTAVGHIANTILEVARWTEKYRKGPCVHRRISLPSRNIARGGFIREQHFDFKNRNWQKRVEI